MTRPYSDSGDSHARDVSMSLSFASATNQHAVAIPLMPLVAEQLEKFENSTDVRNPSESSTATVATMATVVLGVKDDCNIRVRNPETNSKLFGLISRRHCRLEVQRVSPCTTRLVLLDGVRSFPGDGGDCGDL